jgi:two-component system, OmpR family, phosphate regulon sensor histidine kinase PhoR
MGGLWVQIVAAAGAVAGLIAAVAAARRRRRALAELEGGLLALDEGRPVRPIRTRAGGPAGRLARAFNEVAPMVEARIGRLEQERRQLGDVLGGMAEGVIAVDARRRLAFVNDAAARLFGLDGEAVGRLVAELIRNPQVQEAVEATLSWPFPHRAEIQVAGPEGWHRGRARVLAVQGTPLPGTPPAGAVLVFHDVTEVRRLERVRQDFVANASHELKTPLASIKSYTEALLDGALHDESVNAHFLRQIDAQADRLNQLIMDMLSLARLDSGQELLHLAPMFLAPLVRRCVEAQRGRAEAKRLDYGLNPAPADDATVAVADEEAIRQIVDNLIDNAIKYTPEGGRVRVTLRDEGESLALEVADSGIGIPRDDLPRIFERFYRVDKARSRALGGTGLGLSIVKNLVGALGGQVAVDSRLGAGSTFTVRLPRSGPSPPRPS